MATAVIDTDYNVQANGDGTIRNETATDPFAVRHNTTASSANRSALRYDVSGVTAGSTVSDSVLQVNITSESIETTDTVNIHAYNADGLADPEADTTQQVYDRAAGGSALVSETTNYQSTGSVSTDLGTTADGLIEDALSGGIFTIGFSQTNFINAEFVAIEGIDDAGTDPATLTITYTAPAAGTVPMMMMMGVGV